MSINYIPDEIKDELKSAILEYNKEKIKSIKEQYDIHQEALNVFVANTLNENKAFEYCKYMNIVDILFPDILIKNDEIYKIYCWLTKIGFLDEDTFIDIVKNVKLDLLRENIRQEIALMLLYIYKQRQDLEKIEYYLDISGGKFYDQQY